MKKFIAVLLGLLIQSAILAQTPAGFSYQAVLRNAEGQVLANQSASLRVSLTNSDGSTTFYSETHELTSSAQGVIQLVVGNGQNKTGRFASTPWGTQIVYIDVALMVNGAGSYTSMGRQPLQAVPYALFAADGVSIQWLGELATAPLMPSKNQAFYSTTDKKSYIWDGDSWEIIAMDGMPGPAGTGLTLRGGWSSTATYSAGDYVFDESTSSAELNSMWICQAPVGPSAARPRYDTAHWVEFEAPAGPQGPAGLNAIPIHWLGSFSAAPTSPTVNQAYYNSTDRKSYIWDGATWNILAKDGEPGGISIPGINGQLLVHNGNTWTATGKISINADTVGIGTLAPISKLVVKSDATAQPEDPIFEVRNSDGYVVFGVYNEGVRVYINSSGKGNKGGFAIGGISGAKENLEYFRITPDSARIYINSYPTTKGAKGGFAIGGISGAKGTMELLRVTADSTRVFINSTGKGSKGGFAIGGISGAKGTQEYLRVTPDSTRVYVNELPTKGAKGGFAIGGISGAKGTSVQFLNLTPENYFVGHESGKSISGGLYNSFLGYQAGMQNTTGSSNSLLGYQAGYNNTEGTSNLFLGFQSGYSNSAGSYNSFLGYQAGFSNTTGRANTFLGSYTGQMNTEGNSNTFIGFRTGLTNLIGLGNVFIGDSTGLFNYSGSNNVFIGSKSGFSNSSGNDNIFIGQNSGYYNVAGEKNTFLGYNAGNRNNGSYNIFLGNEAGFWNQTGQYNCFIGYRAGYISMYSSYNTFIGYESGISTKTGAANVFLGYRSGYSNQNGANSIYIGNESGFNNDSSYNVFVGTYSGRGNNGAKNTFLGYKTGYNATQGGKNVFIGDSTGYNSYSGNQNVFIGSSAGVSNIGSSNVFIGASTGLQNYEGASNVFLGQAAGMKNASGSFSNFIGYRAGFENVSGSQNIFLGSEAGLGNQSGSYNLFIGNKTGYSNQANYNVFLGFESGFSNVLGTTNVFLGYQAGRTNSSGSNNAFIGNQAGFSNSSGNENVFLGFNAGLSNTGGASPAGSFNTFLGSEAGKYNTSGSNNIYIGRAAGTGSTSGSAATNNVFLGNQTGKDITSGSSNVFIGYQAGYSNTASSSNVYIGHQASYSNRGHDNVVIGKSADANGNATDFYYNVIIGTESGYNNRGSWNTILGYQAGYSNITGASNVLLGNQAGYSNISSSNVYIGYWAGRENNRTDGENVFIGRSAGEKYNGWQSVGIGAFAGYQGGGASSGRGNVFIGSGAGYYEPGNYKLHISSGTTDLNQSLISGDFINKTLKFNADVTVSSKLYSGSYSGGTAGSINAYSMEVGGVSPSGTNGFATIYFHHNAALAHQLRYTNGTLYLEAAGNGYGTNATPSLSVGGALYAGLNGGNVGIGTTTTSNKLEVAGTARFASTISGYVATIHNNGNTSSYNGLNIIAGTNASGAGGTFIRFQRPNAVFPYTPVTTGSIEQLDANTISYNTTSDERLKENIVDSRCSINDLMKVKVRDFNFKDDKAKKTQTGFIAQELYTVYPFAVSKPSTEDDLWQVDYGRITPLLVKAIQDQQAQINSLKDENEQLRVEIENIKALLKR